VQRRRAILASLSWILVSLLPGNSGAQPAPLPDIYTQIQAALDYITYSSWTEENPNSVGWSWFQPTDDIHGAINDIRVPINGPPNHHAWVQPAIEATAAIGMMQGLAFLNDNGIDISTYDAVIDKFFLVWELAHQQGQNRDPGSADYGAFIRTTPCGRQT